MCRKQQLGITLLEVMVTVAIAGILAAIATPAMRMMLQNDSASSTGEEFVSMANYARSEAIREGAVITICAASDTTQTQCVTDAAYVTTTTWANGWILFQDINNNGSVAAAANILKIRTQLRAGTNITSAVRRISYNNNGIATVGGATTYTIKSTNCTGTNGKTITVSTSGMVSMADATCP